MKQFGFTEHTDIADIKKFDKIFEIEDNLNLRLKLSDYTKNIQEIVFVTIAMSEKFSPITNFIKFRTKSKTIELGVNLPYNQFITADKQTEFDLLKNAYIEGIETLLSKRKDIDWKKLSADFKNLFEN